MRRSVKRNVLPYAIGLLLALLPLDFAGAEQPAAKVPPADVLFAVYPAQPAAQAFVAVVVQAIRYKLTERGLAAVTADDTKDPARLDAQARKPGIPIVLRCGISVSDTRLLAISLEWHDLKGRGAPVRQDKSGPLDLDLDSVILQALDSLMGAVSPRVDELVAARAAAAPAIHAPAGPAAGTETAAEQGGEQAGGTGEAAAAIHPPGAKAEGQPAAPPGLAVAPAPAGRPYFVLDAAVAPFVPVGAASLYFPIGVLPSVDARLVFPTSSGRIALGLHAAAMYFSATGTIDSAQDVFVPVGIDVRYEIGSGAPFLFFAHVSGGPALIVIATAAQGTLTDVSAYFKSGIGATFMFNPRFGLSFAVDYEIYFEMPYLIMGFAPWMAVSFKL
jgi:hypothetical protein